MTFWEIVAEVQKNKSQIHDSNKRLPDETDQGNKSNENEQENKNKEDVNSNEKSNDLVADVVVITAVEDEYIAARNCFQNIYSEYFQNGFKYCLANYEVIEGKKIIIAIFRQNNMGLVSASMTATYALNKLNPKILLMCGVCASTNKDANLGDLIVFSPVYDYGSGKYYSGEFFPDYRQHQLNGEVRPIIEEMCSDKSLKRAIKDEWKNQKGKPATELEIHIYSGGSGAAVITDEKVIESLKTHQRTLGAIDMESYAIAEVASAAMTKEIPWLVVKGVQDYASPLKNDLYREYSAFVSAVFLKYFLKKFFPK